VRATFLEGAEAFVDVARSVPVSRLDDRATEAWTLRELLAHGTRGLRTVEATVAAPVDPDALLLSGAAAYFERAMSATGVHQGIEQRARDAAAALGDDPGGYAEEALLAVRPIVGATPLDHIVQHAAGRIRFGEYLATRVVELTLHTADVQLALGDPVAFPAAASVVTRDVLLALIGRGDPLAVACALSGRGASCNLLG
jgi:hypothetical protein